MMLITGHRCSTARRGDRGSGEGHKINHELQNEIHSRSTHSFGYVGAHVPDSKRKCSGRGTIGSVSGNGRRLGDFRFVIRKIEMKPGYLVPQGSRPVVGG